MDKIYYKFIICYFLATLRPSSKTSSVKDLHLFHRVGVL